ncbi:9848_t:CDS:2 [Ambispora gerdemannii]|uniref:9848_t:CDS:1 n=1 Tax=Ambispora gerdemannii TaxID=144530 RepID=A0A9N9C3U9_9GLOM|nr:9848_t:CDS:2 [Ambispora gerdemannii]
MTSPNTDTINYFKHKPSTITPKMPISGESISKIGYFILQIATWDKGTANVGVRARTNSASRKILTERAFAFYNNSTEKFNLHLNDPNNGPNQAPNAFVLEIKQFSTKTDLYAHFQKFGPIYSLKIHPGRAYIQYFHKTDAEQALDKMPKIPEQSVTPSNGVHDTQHEEIELFLESLKNKPTLEQKQKLGDKLFPKVKATVKSLGMKAQASKVTIILLDTDDLRELAHSMNDPERFKVKVEAAVAKIASGSIAAK